MPSEPIILFDAYRPSANSLEERRLQWDELHALSVLQGIVNRKRPRLYLRLVGDQGSIDRFWWEVMTRPGAWMEGKPTQTITSLDGLIKRFRSDLKGLVVWDEKVPATSNVATTLCGLRDGLPVRYDPAPTSLYSKLTHDGWPVLQSMVGPHGESKFGSEKGGSAKNAAYRWCLKAVQGDRLWNPRKMGYFPDAWWISHPNGLPADRALLSNQDYVVAHRGLVFDLDAWDDQSPDDDRGQKPGTDYETLRSILRAAYDRAKGQFIHVSGFTPWDLKYTDFTGNKHGGVDTEWRYAEILSCFNAYMDADAPGLGPMANASFFQHMPLKPRYVQKPAQTPALEDKHYYAFYVGDYDSSAWLYRMLPDLWQDPNRGRVPLGWAFNPNLADRFPVGMNYTRETASPMDSFIAGDSGAGYLNPGYLEPPRKWSGLPSGLEEWEKHCATLYMRWGIDLTGFVIDGNAPEMNSRIQQAYARFSSGGVVAQKVPEMSLVSDTPFLRMGSDLDRDNLDKSVQIVLDSIKGQGATFHLFRTILASPTWHLKLVEAVKAKDPQAEVVDARTLMRLIRKKLER